MKIIITLFYLGFISFGLIAQTSYPSEVTALRINDRITLDGYPNEALWSNAMKISNFSQREQSNGEPVSERTEVALVYDEYNLYIGIWCYDSEPDNLTAKYMKRDFPYWEDDNFEVIFDTFLDKRNGYVFVINPNGARADVQITDEGSGFNIDWNGIWDAWVMRDERGWFAEIEIPFSTLKFPESKEQIWGVNFERNIRRKKEAAFWQGWSRDYDFEHVSHAGTLIGITGITPENPIELKPYLLGGVRVEQENKVKSIGKAGADLNYLISPNLKLNLTANTDFAQVESDKNPINLSRFSIFFPEKREFFLEGKHFFELDIDDEAKTFYTRRIGINQGAEIPIIAGARILGRVGATNLGLLSIQTDASGDVESANYSVVRLREEVLDKSYIGGIISSKNSQSRSNSVFGADFLYSTSSIFGKKNLQFQGILAANSGTGLGRKSLAYKAAIEYPNDDMDAGISFIGIQKDFNPETGYISRRNIRALELDWKLYFRPNILDFVHKIGFKPISIDLISNDESGRTETFEAGIKLIELTFKSGDFMWFDIKRTYERIDESFELFDGAVINPAEYWFTLYSLGIYSFEGRSLRGGISLDMGNYYNSSGFVFAGELSFSLSKNARISSSINHINLDFPSVRVREQEFYGRFEYSFSPKFYSAAFAQWNSNDRTSSLNLRLNWIPEVGSDIYIVMNQKFSSDGKLKLEDTSVLAKVSWRLAI